MKIVRQNTYTDLIAVHELDSPCDSLIGFIPHMTVEDAEMLAREVQPFFLYKDIEKHITDF